jgi:pyruvate carboxylase
MAASFSNPSLAALAVWLDHLQRHGGLNEENIFSANEFPDQVKQLVVAFNSGRGAYVYITASASVIWVF